MVQANRNQATSNDSPLSGKAAGRRTAGLLSLVALAQALYFIVTGLWPILSMATFEAVTGPKFDTWLAKTVGALVTVISLVLVLAALRRSITLEIVVLAIGSALALAIVDVVYVVERIIRPVYLIDAVAQALLIALWIAVWLMHRGNVASAFHSSG
jgi:hypothetical protein